MEFQCFQSQKLIFFFNKKLSSKSKNEKSCVEIKHLAVSLKWEIS